MGHIIPLTLSGWGSFVLGQLCAYFFGQLGMLFLLERLLLGVLTTKSLRTTRLYIIIDVYFSPSPARFEKITL